ncbi:MAG TPA: hypothetical protein VGF76_01525 [Polyangiaceae bacterium]
MTDGIQLHHVGEVVLAEVLGRLNGREELDIPCVAHPHLHPPCNFRAILSAGGLTPPYCFDSNAPLAPAWVGDAALRFDGAHEVDVFVRGGLRGLAIEAKLGLERLSASQFQERFLGPASVSEHKPRRIKGSMIAILNHRDLAGMVDLPLQTGGDQPTQICDPWVLVVRRRVWASWGKRAPRLSRHAHVLVFEEIVAPYGSGQLFDSLVRDLVGCEFLQSWGLAPTVPT